MIRLNPARCRCCFSSALKRILRHRLVKHRRTVAVQNYAMPLLFYVEPRFSKASPYGVQHCRSFAILSRAVPLLFLTTPRLSFAAFSAPPHNTAEPLFREAQRRLAPPLHRYTVPTQRRAPPLRRKAKFNIG